MHASALVLCCLQVPLMAALPTAQAAMDAHRGMAAVAEQGLGFLLNLAVAKANKVSWWVCFGQSWGTILRARVHVCPTRPLQSCSAVRRCR
jgi:hypothetical protein